MPTNRVPVRHSRKVMVTDEMADLFAQGLALIKARKRESAEFREIDKKLNWTLLHRAGQTSVFDSEILAGGPPPDYMVKYLGGGEMHGWDTALKQRAALMDALKKQDGRSDPG